MNIYPGHSSACVSLKQLNHNMVVARLLKPLKAHGVALISISACITVFIVYWSTTIFPVLR